MRTLLCSLVLLACATPALAQGHSVTLTCTPGSAVAGVTVSGFNVYRSSMSGSSYTKLNSALLSSCSYVDKAVVAASKYFYVMTAVATGGSESAYSNEVSALIPVAAPTGAKATVAELSENE